MSLEFRRKVLPEDRNVEYVSVKWYLKSDMMKSLRESVWRQKRGREKTGD